MKQTKQATKSMRLFQGLMVACTGGLLLPSPLPTARAEPVRESYPVARYEMLWSKSPFTLASQVEDAPQPGFADELVLVAVAQEDGRPTVIVVNKKTQARQLVTSDAANTAGLKLESIEPNDDPLKVRARIRKGSEVGVVKYDMALLAVRPPPPAKGKGPPVPKTGRGSSRSPTPSQVGRPRPSGLPTPKRQVRRRLVLPSPRK